MADIANKKIHQRLSISLTLERLGNSSAIRLQPCFVAAAPDILMVAVLRQVQHTNLLNMYPNVASYLTRCHDRPAWRKCLDAYHRRLAV